MYYLKIILAAVISGMAAAGCNAQTKKSAVPGFESLRINVGINPIFVTIADVNNDGNADIICANGGSHDVTILLGNGKGKFSEVNGSPFPAGNSPNDIAVADFNGDSKPDLAFANHEAGYITVLLGNGEGKFISELKTNVQSKPHPHSIAVGDFNGDGKTDAAIESWANNQIEVLFGNGDGKFQTPGILINVGKMPYQRIRSSDINSDNKPDILITNFKENSVSVLLCNGKGEFAPSEGSPFTVPPSPFGIAVGDVNGDHNPDLAIIHYSGQSNDASDDGLSVLIGDGHGKFELATGSPFLLGKAPVSLAVGDINNDGIFDIASCNFTSNNVSVYLGSSNGFIKADGSPFAVGQSPSGVALGDLNGDGKADIVTANNEDNDITVLLSK